MPHLSHSSEGVEAVRLLNASEVESGSVGEPSNTNSPVERKKLGMFMGVFVPVVLSQFGIVLFLRLSWTVGQAGLWQNITMWLIAGLACTFTIMSIAAVATNGEIKGGGTYYLISRCLGPEIGGSVGILLYCGSVLSNALVLLGFAETFDVTLNWNFIENETWRQVVIASIALLAMTAVCLPGAAFISRAGLTIFAILNVVIVIVITALLFQRSDHVDGFTGPKWATLSDNWNSAYTEDISTHQMQDYQSIFIYVFASLLGLTAGANMSGDLRNPGRSIAVGTFCAVGYSLLVYIILSTLIAFSVDRSLLLSNYYVFQKVCFSEYIVVVGVVLSSLSSSLALLAGASRILQAIARDNLLPILRPFASGYGADDNPVRCVLFMWFISQCILFVGKLNLLAPISTMIFLVTYFWLNGTCFLLRISGAPNFRPLFHFFTWHTALLGALICFGMMWVVDHINALICVLILLVLSIYIHYISPIHSWGDITQALIYHQVRKYLLRLHLSKEHVKFWRPQVLLLVRHMDANLIDFCNDLKKGGLYVIGDVVVGDFDSSINERAQRMLAWDALIDETKIKAFSEVVVAPDLRTGTANLVMLSGIGAMKPRTIVMPFYKAEPTTHEWPGVSNHIAALGQEGFRALQWDNEEKWGAKLDRDSFGKIVGDLITMRKNVVIARNFHALNKDAAKIALPQQSIDIWIPPHLHDVLENPGPTVSLTCTLGSVLKMQDFWAKYCRLRLCSAASSDSVDSCMQRLERLTAMLRLHAAVEVFPFPAADDTSPPLPPTGVSSDGREDLLRFNQLIRHESQETAVVFLTMPSPPHEHTLEAISSWIDDLDVLSTDLPATLLCHGISTVHAVNL